MNEANQQSKSTRSKHNKNLVRYLPGGIALLSLFFFALACGEVQDVISATPQNTYPTTTPIMATFEPPIATPTWAWDPKVNPTNAYMIRRSAVDRQMSNSERQKTLELMVPGYYPDAVFDLMMTDYSTGATHICSAVKVDQEYVQAKDRNNVLLDFLLVRLISDEHCFGITYQGQIEAGDQLSVKTMRESQPGANFRDFAGVMPLEWLTRINYDGTSSKIAELTFAIPFSATTNRVWSNISSDRFGTPSNIPQNTPIITVGFPEFSNNQVIISEGVFAGYSSDGLLISSPQVIPGISGGPYIIPDGTGQIIGFFEAIGPDSFDLNYANPIPPDFSSWITDRSWLPRAKNSLLKLGSLAEAY